MAEAKTVGHSEDDYLDNVSNKYMNLEERAHESVKGGEKSKAKVKHHVTSQGAEYALPEDAVAEVKDDYSQLESGKYISFDDKGNAISCDTQNTAKAKNLKHITTEGGVEYAVPNKSDPNHDEYQNVGSKYMNVDSLEDITRNLLVIPFANNERQNHEENGDYEVPDEIILRSNNVDPKQFLNQSNLVI